MVIVLNSGCMVIRGCYRIRGKVGYFLVFILDYSLYLIFLF